MTPTIGRARWMAAPVAVLVATLLTGCTTESVTPASSTTVVYAAIGATAPNPGDTVAVVQSSTGKLGRPVTVGTLPSAVALVRGAKYLLVTVRAQNELVEVDTGSGKVVHRIEVGLEPDAVAVTPDGSTALVANFGDNTVTEVHVSGFTVGRTIPVGRQPVAVAITPDGRQALVANFQDGTLTPLALPSLTAGPSVPAGAGPVAISVPSTTRALVADFQTSSVTPVSLPSLTPQAAIALGANPTGIDAVTGATTAWVSAGFGITPVSLLDGAVGKAVPLGVAAQCITVSPTAQAWVCSGNSALVEVDLMTGKVLRTVHLSGIPAAAVVAFSVRS